MTVSKPQTFEPENLPAVVDHLLRLLAERGADGATAPQLFEALRAEGYGGDRLGVVVALDVALTDGRAVVSSYPYGRYWAPGLEPGAQP